MKFTTLDLLVGTTLVAATLGAAIMLHRNSPSAEFGNASSIFQQAGNGERQWIKQCQCTTGESVSYNYDPDRLTCQECGTDWELAD